MRKINSRVEAWMLTFGPVFLLIAVTACSLGMSYGGVFGTYVKQVHPLEQWFPPEFWTFTWCAVGLVGLALAAGLQCKWIFKNVVITAWVTLACIWGSSWFTSWLSGTSDRGVALSAWYVGTALYVSWSIWRFKQYEKKIAKMGETITAQDVIITRLEEENRDLRRKLGVMFSEQH